MKKILLIFIICLLPITGIHANSNKKLRILIFPTSFAPGVHSNFESEVFDKFNISDTSFLENPGFSGYLKNAFVNTNKFDVLERKNIQKVLEEIDFGATGYSNTEKSVKAGQMLNADYIVIPEIRYVAFNKNAKDVPFIPKDEEAIKATLGTNTRIVEVNTSKLVSSLIKDSQYSGLVSLKTDEEYSNSMKYLSEFFDSVAKKVTYSIVNEIYPIKIIDVTNNQVTLNRGKDAINIGENYKVYKTGKTLIDPDTNEEIKQEINIGTIKVKEVLEKTSIAKIIEQKEKIETLNICRKNEK
ncbi:hypothetical protein BVX93_01875 [bacterium B13(2017)]|nr:hypothetical protein BVX93_01875 [bacterium B13(2017)]